MSELDIKLVLVFLAIFITQLITIIKVAGSQKYIEKRLDQIDLRLNKQNGRIDGMDKYKLQHIKEFHSKK